MPLPEDLLDQALLLATKEPRRPKQASLRRAVSAAYYAVFHLIVRDSAIALSPSAPAGLRQVVQRSFQHGTMRLTCHKFMQMNSAKLKNRSAGLSGSFEGILEFPIEAELIAVLTIFVDLQEARHKADYDVSTPWDRFVALSKVSLARDAFVAWAKIRKRPNTYVFMTCLLHLKEWGR